MNDFISDIITQLNAEVPELGNRIQPNVADAGTATPYAAFSLPEEVPIRTCDGIAGYDISFEVAVLATRHAQAIELKSKIIVALDQFSLSTSQRCSYEKSESRFYMEQNIHGFILTFQIS